MKKETTVSDINQSFNKMLLSVPAAPLQDNLESYDKALTWLKKHIKKKIRPQDVGKQKIIEELLKKWEDLYERATAKEKELKSKGKDPNKRFMYYAGSPGQLDRTILFRLKRRGWVDS